MSFSGMDIVAEECEDGNSIDGDNCNNSCQIKDGIDCYDRNSTTY